MDDLAVIIVSTNEAQWLTPCLSTLFAHLGALRSDVVVADNSSTDGTRELVEREFSEARVVTCANYGFGHANNRAALTTNARYVLFLNPDTEIREGSFEELVARMDASPRLGLVGVKQITADDELFPTVRRFPNALRSFFQAMGSERYPFRAPWLGERELDLERYEHEIACDWTSGSFMLARREALESAGLFDERFFIYSEETDLCLRIKAAGWDIRHFPTMTIVHHAEKAGVSPRMASQDAFARKLYSDKHFSPAHRVVYVGALALGYGIRAVAPRRHDRDLATGRRSESRAALATLLGRRPPPFGAPPAVALNVFEGEERSAPRATSLSQGRESHS
jgi:N-acetylglucosaminyl-diphospho-decaprenol L-rhamnosyltransferase